MALSVSRWAWGIQGTVYFNSNTVACPKNSPTALQRGLALLTSLALGSGILFPPSGAASRRSSPLGVEVTTRFVYDGDGGKVKRVTGEGTTLYLGETFEIAPETPGTRT